MAVIHIYGDMLNMSYPDNVQLLSASSSQIVFGAGSYRETYGGSFYEASDGYPGGRLQTISATYGSSTILSVTGINCDAHTFSHYLYDDGADYAIAYALSGADTLYGSRYNDAWNGCNGNDVLHGASGNDTLYGGYGDDRVYGDTGNDYLLGDAGNDYLYGGTGRDTLVGGAGSDDFVFNSIAEAGNGTGRDIIKDFQHSYDDIDLRNIDANTQVSGNQAFTYVGGHTFTHHAGELRYAGGVVYGDVNGDGVADFSITIENRAALSTGDFLL